MKKSINLLLVCILALLSPSTSNGQNIFEGFENNPCTNSNGANTFFAGCFPDWFSISGTPDTYSLFGAAYEGSKYAHMYSIYAAGCASNYRGESIAINYDFQANQEYTINYALGWNGGSNSCYTFEAKWILTNDRANQSGTSSDCNDLLPAVAFDDDVIRVHNLPYTSSPSWQAYSHTFTPTSNYNQLWLRPRTYPKSSDCPGNSSSSNIIYLDAFEIETCVTSGYSTNFAISPTGNLDGSVSVNTSANPNPVPVKHWWDIYYAPNGSTNGNSQVPGNPAQCCSSSTASFDNNLYVNTWYYIKHGIWNDCINWRESRKRFRVQVPPGSSSKKSGKIEYIIEIEDVDFEPTKEYLASMNEMVSNLSDEELELHSQVQLDFTTKPPVNSITNYPNPFTNTTTIEFTLEEEQTISLSVYDLRGRLIAKLLENEPKSAGQNQIAFDGSSLTEGIYFYTIESNGFKETKKMVLSK